MRWNKNGINSVLPLLIVEFDFIFIFINDDDCDWAQRNQTINMRCTWAHFQHHHRGSNRLSVWRSSLLCVPGSLVHLNYIISFRWWCISLFRSISQTWDCTSNIWMLMCLFPSFQTEDFSKHASYFAFSSLCLCKMNSSKFLVGKFMGNSSLLHYKSFELLLNGQ